MMSRSDLSSLNPAQRAAVEFDVAAGGGSVPGRPLLIIAGAGSGKTRTLAHRVAHLILNGADPGRMLLLTFTRRAAEQMIRQVERICDRGMAGAGGRAVTWSGTFHAIGHQLLRLYAGQIGLDPRFTVLDRSDAADLLDLVRDEMRLSEQRRRFPKKATCLAIYSYAANAQLSLEQVLDQAFPWCREWQAELRQLFGGYVAAKQGQAVVDYDDLLLYWARMMGVPAIAADVGQRFDHVLVDEYQDTNALQAGILRALKADGRGLTVVGDDAQSIYGFRAATVRNILDFPSSFAPPAAVITLEQNYRSTEPILEAANAVMSLAPEGFRKRLFSARRSPQKPWLVTVQDDLAEVGHVAATILANREAGIPLRDQAVLFRTSHHSSQLELELRRRNIPYVKFGGLKFLELAHVKDVLAILRWAENPRDRVAAFRLLQLLPGIGPGIARRMLSCLEQAAYRFVALADAAPPRAAGDLWPALVSLMQVLAARESWAGQLELVRRFYDPLLEERYDFARVRLADLDELVRLGATYRSRQQFLTELTLDPPAATGDESGPPLLDEDYLILSTIHSAKGREWRVVYLLRVVDGCIPSDMATGSAAEIEEERRLLYVAMTRARDQLHLLHPRRFYTHDQGRFGDRYVTAPRSRFIPPALLHHFDLGSAARPGRSMERATPGLPKVDIAAEMRAMWA
jgi:DNA helicase-2/ATP-dependent DNA helicase PcrA